MSHKKGIERTVSFHQNTIGKSDLDELDSESIKDQYAARTYSYKKRSASETESGDDSDASRSSYSSDEGDKDDISAPDTNVKLQQLKNQASKKRIVAKRGEVSFILPDLVLKNMFFVENC